MIPELLKMGERNHKEYQSSEPFPHILIQNLFPEDFLSGVLLELDDFFTKTKDNGEIWRVKKNKNSFSKYGTSNIKDVGPLSFETFDYLSSQEFVQFLSLLTGIDNLHCDSTLKGGGFHLIGRDGFLKIHADFNYHPDLKKYRRVNLLLYLNKGWPEDYGGHLELWDRDMDQKVKCYLPEFNNCVIFTASDFSFHGHPHPLNCPADTYRKSIAMYYYTDEKPADMSTGYHSTLYREI